MRWHIWVEDSENEHIYHSETWLLTKKMMHEPAHTVAFTIPIFEPLPPQYYVRYGLKFGIVGCTSSIKVQSMAIIEMLVAIVPVV